MALEFSNLAYGASLFMVVLLPSRRIPPSK